MSPSVQHKAVHRPSLGSAVPDMRRRLEAAGIESAEEEALWLIEHALALTGLHQIVDRDRVLTDREIAKLHDVATRRVAREPLQYILGTQEFCGLEFEVNPTVLIPRPETELLAHEIIRRLPQGTPPTLMDVGTGSGCLAVTLARSIPQARILATDISTQALETAMRNARRHGVDSSITWLHGDLLGPLRGLGLEGSMHAILANPPYIRESEWAGLQPEVSRYEPRLALVAGPRGTEVHERLLREALFYLMPGGWLAMEVGEGQSLELCSKIAAMPDYERVEVVPDEAGINRVVIVRRAR
jgi:release factor glutamine methyltransferase